MSTSSAPAARKVRKDLSADALYDLVRNSFAELPDHRHEKATIPLADALACAMFSLKDPSLLAFDERRNDQNMKALFGIGQIPSDTQMREILDPLEPDLLRPVFNDVFRQLQRGKALEPYVFHDGCYLMALDGTGYFSSNKVHCDSCLEKKNKQTGEVTYQHQMLGAAIVHPDHKEVIPLAPEPIQKLDGSSIQDRVTTKSWKEGDVTYDVAFTHKLPLNESNQVLLVNFLQYTEYVADGHRRKHFTWVTDLRITPGNALHLVRGGRARWKIENETFNTPGIAGFWPMSVEQYLELLDWTGRQMASGKRGAIPLVWRRSYRGSASIPAIGWS